MSQQAVHDWIRKTVASNDVVLFMKGTKNFPQCGFSSQVAQILAHVGVDYQDVNVLDNMEVRDGIKSFTNWPTIPSSTSRASSSAAAISSARCSRPASCTSCWRRRASPTSTPR